MESSTPKVAKNEKKFVKSEKKIEKVHIMSDVELLETCKIFLNNKNWNQILDIPKNLNRMEFLEVIFLIPYSNCFPQFSFKINLDVG